MSADIATEARRQLADVGARALSLRAVARELGMASSAMYRFSASRDGLRTAMIVEAYDALGEVAERPHRLGAPPSFAGRLSAARSDNGRSIIHTSMCCSTEDRRDLLRRRRSHAAPGPVPAFGRLPRAVVRTAVVLSDYQCSCSKRTHTADDKPPRSNTSTAGARKPCRG